jgi:hypothetical protein
MSKSKSKVTLWLAVLSPIISSWRQAPWDSDQRFFSQLNPCGHSSYVTSSLTRRWICLLRIFLAFRQV